MKKRTRREIEQDFINFVKKNKRFPEKLGQERKMHDWYFRMQDKIFLTMEERDFVDKYYLEYLDKESFSKRKKEVSVVERKIINERKNCDSVRKKIFLEFIKNNKRMPSANKEDSLELRCHDWYESEGVKDKDLFFVVDFYVNEVFKNDEKK